jgi:hypothetical protein
MSSRSERYRANAEKCQQYADAADSFGRSYAATGATAYIGEYICD